MVSSFKFAIFVFSAILAQTYAENVRLCVDNTAELEKCQALSDALKVQNAGVEFECVSNNNCVNLVESGSASATIVNADDHPEALKKLEAILYETYDDDNLIVALIDEDKVSEVNDLPLTYKDKNDLRLLHGGLYINHHRNDGKCIKVDRPNKGSSILLERYHQIKNEGQGKQLVCLKNGELVTRPIREYKTCNVESNIPNAVMVKNGDPKRNEIARSFLTAANKVGHGRHFQLFGPFKGHNNLIFSDDTKALVPNHSEPNGVSVAKFLEFHCGIIENHEHANDDKHGDHHHHHH